MFLCVAVAAQDQGSSALSDDEILKRLPDLPSEQLQDLLSVYSRLDNSKMAVALKTELNQRGEEESAESSDKVGGVDGDDGPPSPYEAFEADIDALVAAGRHSEAIAKLEKLRADEFKGQIFPFEIELADGYGSVGNYEAARFIYFDVLSRSSSTSEQKNLAQAGLNEIEKLEGAKLVYDLIKAKKPVEALARATELRTKFPDDVEMQLIYAEALVPNYRYAEALPILESIKSKHYSTGGYPAQDALAESLRAMGRFEEASAAYDVLLADTTLLPGERLEAVVAARSAAHERASTIQGSGEFVKEAEGRGRLYRMHAKTSIAPRLFAGVNAWYYDVSLSPERSLIQSSGEFTGATAFVRSYLDDQFTFREIRGGGGSNGEGIFGFSVGKERAHPGAIGYELSVDLNTPTLDSLQLIALNGTENRAGAELVAPLPGRFEFAVGGFGRRIEADGSKLGDSYGAYLEIGRVLWKNTQDTASLNLAYRATYERFDASQISNQQVRQLGVAGDPEDGRLLGDDLLEPFYHPHGLEATYEVSVNENVSAFAGAGLLYDFADEEWDYNFTSGLDYALTSSIDLVLEGGYYSDGTGANNNNEAVYVGNLGLRSFF